MKKGIFLSEKFMKTQSLIKSNLLTPEKILSFFRQLLIGVDFSKTNFKISFTFIIFSVHNSLKRSHSFLQTNSIFIDEKDNLKISDYWIKDLLDQNNFSPSDLKDTNSDGKLKDKKFILALLNKMIWGNEPVKDSSRQENWPDSLHKFIDKIKNNEIESIEDMMVCFYIILVIFLKKINFFLF